MHAFWYASLTTTPGVCNSNILSHMDSMQSNMEITDLVWLKIEENEIKVSVHKNVKEVGQTAAAYNHHKQFHATTNHFKAATR